MKLSGWQRLWVVATVLWLIGSGVTLWQVWPSTSRTRLDPETGEQEPAGWTPQEHVLSEAEFNAVKDRVTKAAPNGLDEAAFNRYFAPALERALKDAETSVVVIRDDNGTETEFPPGTDPKKAAALVRHHKYVRAAQFFTVWLVPPAVLYALGWSVGWVCRGFTKKGDSA